MLYTTEIYRESECILRKRFWRHKSAVSFGESNFGRQEVSGVKIISHRQHSEQSFIKLPRLPRGTQLVIGNQAFPLI